MENSAPESVKQLIRKIHTLSLRGVGGEAETAKRKLDKLLTKYSIELAEVVRDVVKTYEFPYKTTQEEKIICQCYVSLGVECPKIFEYTRRGRKVKSLGLDLTPAQYIDLKGMVAYYKSAFKKEADRLLSAFIQRHKLYPPPTGEERESAISLEEIEQIMTMMRGLGEKSYFKPAGYLSA